MPPLRSHLPSAFVEDRNGVLWVGFDSEGLARRRSNGRFEYFDPQMGWPAGRVRASYLDSKGRLWFGASTGLWRLDDASAVKPKFRRYTPEEGISSLTIYSITGDAQGRIYIGTGNGVDRLHPDSGRIEHFSTSDGLPSGVVQAVYTDHQGNVWLATRHGVARLIPEPARSGAAPPAVLITALKVRGVDQPLSAAGESDLNGLTFTPSQDQIEFGFAALQFHQGNDLLYQYRLEGAGSAGWSAPSTARSVNFATLRSGSYRFQVRETAAPARIATVQFRILPPVWATWWFLLGATVIVIACIYGFYRYRLRLALEREHLRMRIATDLHDDIGSSLSRIAIWSEVAAQEASRIGSKLLQPLSQIGDVSRETIDSMSDIVWSVNPKYDRFADLASRMRRYASDVGAGANVTITFTVRGEDEDESVGPAPRRDVFLVLKEALNNALRHARCTECAASLSLDSGWITLAVEDNGKGFDPNAPRTGHGLDSMARRAMSLGGTLRVESAPGKGARIELRVLRSARDRGPHLRYLHK